MSILLSYSLVLGFCFLINYYLHNLWLASAPMILWALYWLGYRVPQEWGKNPMKGERTL